MTRIITKAAISKKVALKKGNTLKPNRITISKVKTVPFKTDARQTATLIKAGRTAVANAIRASKALGLSITYMEKGILYNELPDGTKEVIDSTSPESGKEKKQVLLLKKGMVLHAK